MEVKNPLYKNIGIHVICCLFTVDKGNVKILLIKRKMEPFKDMWALVGGALYNNETVDDGIRREIFEKTGLTNVELYFSGVVDNVDRSPLKRMIAINFIGIIDKDNAILKDTKKTSNADWFLLSNVGDLAYDHNKILKIARDKLKEIVVSSTVLKTLFPAGFTLPELQKTYETILEKQLDRRNFRKKMLSLGLIKDMNMMEIFEGKKPAKKYIFNDTVDIKEIL